MGRKDIIIGCMGILLALTVGVMILKRIDKDVAKRKYER